MKKIGITQRVEIVSNRRERRDCLDQSWTSLLESIGFMAVPIPNRVTNPGGYVLENELSGVILSGGNDLAHLPEVVNPAAERDELEAALIDHCAAASLPLLGVCRGMQMMVCHGGGEIVVVEHHVQTLHQISPSDESSLPLQAREVNSYHRLGVPLERLPSDLKVAAISPDGLVEAVESKKAKQYGIMWHPEREPEHVNDKEILKWVFDRSDSK